jgi:ABC-type phosphate/phosphonate transport system substrate-binding protein
MSFIANARMYSVSPQAEAAWRNLLAAVATDADVPLAYESYPAPQPLERLWARPDLGCVQMCGYPLALGLAEVVPIAAPIPDDDWSGGQALYRSDLVVAAGARFSHLEETFGGVCGWTVDHSQSGFNAFRHHLLAFRTPERPMLYRAAKGPLVTARRIVDSVIDGTIDVGPLDSYWHLLLRLHMPALAAGIRAIGHTAPVPAPPFVCAAGFPDAAAARLAEAFAAASGRPWFAALAEPLRLRGFARCTRDDYAVTLERDAAARAAGYPLPG